MPEIEIKKLKKIYKSADKEVTALDDVNLKIKSGAYNTLLGPSGCGKTTLLRSIAGLLTPTSGEILFDGKNVENLPVQDRHIGFVFQHFAIFPHLNVWDNVAYGPIIQGWTDGDIEKSVKSNLKRVGLSDRPHAMPGELSGGMRQRLGLARALSTNSKILLLDEPLSALDAKIGEFLRYELRRIAKKHHITAIHVTHNQEEAMTISDNIILMKHGRIIQTGSPEEIYEKPNSIFAANFIGKCNFFSGRRTSAHKIECGDKKITVDDGSDFKDVVVGIRPEKIHLENESKENLFSGTIELVNFMGHFYEYQIRSGKDSVWAY
ncbi:MAG: ABC transporter ATP-binding protein, partial [Candidatus Pacebacteria bacterium]|nr:ABC transporter ATP-binding protein [Candidatus Paceibacterota bacterium]